MKSINLLPKHVARQLQYDIIGKLMLTFWVRAIFLLIVFFLLSLGTIFYLKAEISTADNEIAMLKEDLSSANTKEVENRVKALNKTIANLKAFEDQHYYWSEALKELATIMPADVEIDSLILDRATNRVDISGRATTRESAILFYAAVKKSKMFKDINFPLKNLEKAQNSDFSFTFFINPSEIKNHETAN